MIGCTQSINAHKGSHLQKAKSWMARVKKEKEKRATVISSDTQDGAVICMTPRTQLFSLTPNKKTLLYTLFAKL